MTVSAQHNEGLALSDVMRALAAVDAQLEQYSAASDLQALRAAIDGLQAIRQELQAQSYDGEAAYCAALQQLLQELASGELQTLPMHHTVIRRALFTLTHYLEALAAGAPKVALRLFDQYQELLQARGVETAFEVDLFFPEAAAELPTPLLAQQPPEDAPGRIKALRVQYQQALLRWLRAEEAEAAQAMAAAVRAVCACAPPAQRAFWWIAGALLECLELDGLPAELNPRKLLSRIDQQMKALAEGAPPPAKALASEMLYFVARSHAVSDTLDAIRRIYRLDVYLPGTAPLPPGEAGPVLGEMRTLLRDMTESWERCALNEAAACRQFSEQAGRLLVLSGQLGQGPLPYLCEQLAGTAAQAAAADRVQRLSLEMATALLLVGDGLAHYPALDAGFHRQARIVVRRLQAALAGTQLQQADLDPLVQLYCQGASRDAIDQLVRELQGNLQRLAQGLQDFFANPEQRSELSRLERLSGQVQGGMHILAQPAAEQLATLLRQRVADYAAGIQPGPEEQRQLPQAVAALDGCLRDLANGQQPEAADLAQALRALQPLQHADAAALAAGGAEPSAAGEAGELLEVFVEEAQEVLAGLRSNLEAIRLHPANRELLGEMRRGLHTLKGSGRMVGLNDFSDAAWAVERAVADWLQQERPAAPALLQLVEQAAHQFAAWVDSLAKQGAATVEAGELIARARQLERGGEPAQAPTARPARPQRESAPGSEAPAAVAEVRVGGIRLSPTLFEVATAETATHLATLQHQLAEWRAAPHAAVPYAFLRPLHALAAVNRTMGFAAMAELATALEQWLEARTGTGQPAVPAQLELAGEAVAALAAMARAIREAHQEPEALPGLLARLRAQPPATGMAVAAAPPPLARAAAGVRPPQQAGEAAVADDLDPQLLPVFLEEAGDLLPRIGNTLRNWRSEPGDAQQGNRLQRLLHTLKGSARMAGAMRVGEWTHRMEDGVIAAMSSQPDPLRWKELESMFEHIGGMFEQLRREHAAEAEHEGAAVPNWQLVEEHEPATAMLRVRADTLDRLVNEIGEISVARARIEAEFQASRNNLAELTDSIGRLRSQLREIEIQAESQMEARSALVPDSMRKFDPLEFDRFTRFQELTRFMSESVHDVQTVQQALAKSLDEAIAALSTQSHLNRSLQQTLMSIRMVPFSSIGERLYRIVRQTGKELGKQVNLELIGGDVEIDRSVLERMAVPFDHLLRNAIAHGLETPEQRIALDKPLVGEIRLALSQESNEVVFELSDDGAGLDLDELRRRAVQHGLLRAGEAISDEQAQQLIFGSGISTAREVTAIAGRGVGMDVVRSEIAALGGRIDVASERGKGTRFTIRLPLTLAVSQVLMVRAGQSMYALPAGLVEHVLQVPAEILAQFYAAGQVSWRDRPYPLRYLANLLGGQQSPGESKLHNPVLLLRSGEQRMALHVDDLQASQEAVVKNVGSQLARMPGIAGATVLGNGQVVLILNPVLLAQPKSAAQAERVRPTQSMAALPRVMVVDDSLTVRKVTGRMLARAGYEAVTAKDGVDALEQLERVRPAVVLLDIEMPRMDGFEFTRRVRGNPRTKDLPIIMITSRIADKHRNYALELGANAYFGKPYDEAELLRQIAVFCAPPPKA